MSVIYLDHSDGTLVYAGESRGLPSVLKFGTLSVELQFPFYFPINWPRVQVNELDARSAGALITNVKISLDVAHTHNISLAGNTYFTVFGQRPPIVTLEGTAFLKVSDIAKGRNCDVDHPVPWLLLLANATSAPVLDMLLYVKFDNAWLYGPLMSAAIQTDVRMPNAVSFNFLFPAAVQFTTS